VQIARGGRAGNDGGVARVVLGDVLLDLAHEVGAHVGRLGVDAAAHAPEQRDRGAAQAVPGDRLKQALPVVAVHLRNRGRVGARQPSGLPCYSVTSAVVRRWHSAQVASAGSMDEYRSHSPRHITVRFMVVAHVQMIHTFTQVEDLAV